MPTIIARHNIGHAVVIHYNNSTKNAYRIYKLTESNGPVPDLPSICKLKEKEIVYLALNKKVYEDIVTYYPELREECERQLLKKECVFNSDNRREK